MKLELYDNPTTFYESFLNRRRPGLPAVQAEGLEPAKEFQVELYGFMKGVPARESIRKLKLETHEESLKVIDETISSLSQ